MEKINAFKCTFCGKVYENKDSCRAHEYKCYFNPRTKSCASCAFNKIETWSIKNSGRLFEFPSCLVNIDISEMGLQTRCLKYLDRKYRDDSDIMTEVETTYNPEITMDSYVKKHPQIFE